MEAEDEGGVEDGGSLLTHNVIKAIKRLQLNQAGICAISIRTHSYHQHG